jgi:phosphatidylserine/phosphatidylglycerophosphate/cardiolipin synthase-like enzyme
VGTTAVTIIVEPSGDRGQALITAIDAAKTSVHMEMYLLTNDSVVSALTSKASAGVAVQVILNETFPTTDDSNTSVYSTLKAAKGVDVVWASDAFTYTHEKTVIIDGATAWIMTANATEASYDSNREYLAVDTDPTDVAEAEAIFADDFAQSGYKSDSPTSTPTVPGPLVVAPAPPMNSLPDLVALIGSAKQSVYAEVEEIDNTSIANAFVTAVKNGATVDFVVANLSENTSGNAALTTITSGGGHVYIGGAPEATSTATDPYIHAKAIVIDGTKAWIGSENFTTGSLEYNREVGVVFTTPAQVLAVQTAIKSDVASGTALQ